MPGDTPSKNPVVKGLITRRAVCKRRITNAFNAVSENSSVREIKTIHDLVIANLAEIKQHDNDINTDICSEFDGSNGDDFGPEIAIELDKQSEYVLNVNQQLSVLVERMKVEEPKLVPPPNPDDKMNCKLKLPEMSCDSFNGEGTTSLQYHEFLSQFNNIIGLRPNLTKSTKFSYLKTYLRGYALKLVQHLQVSEQNYDIALDLLSKEFLNKDSIVDDLIRKLLDLKPKFDPSFRETKIFINDVRCIISDLVLYDIKVIQEIAANTIISHVVFNKLPNVFKQELVRKIDKNFPTLQEIFDSYVEIVRTLSLRQNRVVETPVKAQKPFKSYTISKTSQVKPTEKPTEKPSEKTEYPKMCKFCVSTSHSTLHCKKYSTPIDRKNRCVELNLCEACSSQKHSLANCRSKLDFKCRYCSSYQHISALCGKYEPSVNQVHFCLNSTGDSGNTFLLPTVTVVLHHGNHSSKINCLLDTGSQRSYISTDVVNRLQYECANKTKFKINTFIDEGEKVFSNASLAVEFSDNRKKFVLPFLVSDECKLTYTIDGLKDAHSNISEKFQLGHLADSDQIMLDGLLGVDCLQFFTKCNLIPCLGGVAFELPNYVIPYGNIDNFLTDAQLSRKYARNSNCQMAQRFTNGAAVSDADSGMNCAPNSGADSGMNCAAILGADCHDNSNENVSTNDEALPVDKSIINFVINPSKTAFDPIGSVISNSSIEERLDNMFSLESLGVKEGESDFDKEQIKTFNENVTFSDNKYFVKLPFNEKITEVKNNFHVCKAILSKVISNLKNKNLYEDYDAIFKQQLHDDIIEQIEIDYQNLDSYTFIPHRPVIRDDETCTTKIRVVLNCSLKIDKSPSLNEASYPGVNLINSLLELLIRVRHGKFLAMGDIRKAFLMIGLNSEEDKRKFCLLWQDENNKLVVFRYKTIPFGYVSSPFILGQVINLHLTKYPQDECTNLLRNNMYVDNLFATSNNPSSLLAMCDTACERMAEGGFELRSWASNSADLANQFERDGRGVEHTSDSHKLLGYSYSTTSDKMSIAPFTPPECRSPSKRSVLSHVSKVFDPTGLMSPVTIRSKLLMRDIWQSKIGWDDDLSEKLNKDWSNLVSDLSLLPTLEFDRLAYDDNVSLIVLCDSSKTSYGFACYASSFIDGRKENNLIFSKVKVAPSTGKTLPTLELMAAHLALKCLPSIITAINKNIVDLIIAVDAQIVLTWILSNHVKVKNVCARNRVKDISEMRKQLEEEFKLTCKFKYIPTELNVSDMLTRGLSFKEFSSKLDLWKHGPMFLRTCPVLWPDSTLGCLSEESKMLTCTAQVQETGAQPILPLEKFSEINKLFRVTANVFKFIWFRIKKEYLSMDYFLNKAKAYWIKQQQAALFESEINFLNKDPVQTTPPPLVQNLNLFMDEEGVLRSKGRLANCEYLPEFVHNPIVIPKHSHLTDLLIRDAHVSCKHLGVASTLGVIRRSGFWIPQGRVVVKAAIKHCVICRKVNNTSFKYPKPNDFVEDRVKFIRPFSHVGIDFTGNFLVKFGEKFTKMYILVFTCYNTRAIHLELLPNMTCQQFVLSFIRFYNMYNPTVLYSDNQSTFLQGMGIINKSYATDDFTIYLQRCNIKHRRIPIYSAWIGSFWNSKNGYL